MSRTGAKKQLNVGKGDKKEIQETRWVFWKCHVGYQHIQVDISLKPLEREEKKQRKCGLGYLVPTQTKGERP